MTRLKLYSSCFNVLNNIKQARGVCLKAVEHKDNQLIIEPAKNFGTVPFVVPDLKTKQDFIKKGLPFADLPVLLNPSVSTAFKEQQAIAFAVGSILGDGSLRMGSDQAINVHVEIENKSLTFALWKKLLAEQVGLGKSFQPNQTEKKVCGVNISDLGLSPKLKLKEGDEEKKTELRSNPSRSFSLTTSPVFPKTVWHEKFRKPKEDCGATTKLIPPDIGDFLVHPLALAIWYLDDGTLTKRNKTPEATSYNYRVATGDVTMEQANFVVKALKNNFNLDFSIEKKGNKPHQYYLLNMPRSNRDNFEALVGPWVCLLLHWFPTYFESSAMQHKVVGPFGKGKPNVFYKAPRGPKKSCTGLSYFTASDAKSLSNTVPTNETTIERNERKGVDPNWVEVPIKPHRCKYCKDVESYSNPVDYLFYKQLKKEL